MTEHIARTVYYLGVHLTFASLVWLAALGLTTLFPASANTKYWIWVATSLNFMFPTGAVLDRIFEAHLSAARPLGFIGRFGIAAAENVTIVGAVWLLGAMLMMIRLGQRLRAEIREAGLHSTRPIAIADGVPVEFCESGAPAVAGILKTRILLPTGVENLLTKPELNAVLLHELTHAQRRDNLIRLIHELGLSLLWFHPLMWISGARLALYREFSCDERVIQRAWGSQLVSAMAKLADPKKEFLLQASATSFLGQRLARLSEPLPVHASLRVNAWLVALFSAAGIGGVYATVMHTACCFILKR